MHLATAYATLTWLLVTQAQVGRAHEFKVVHRPHHAAAALLGEFRQHGRQVGMDVVQVHDVGIEIIEDLAESALDVAPSHEPLGSLELVAQSTGKVHLRGIVAVPARVNILGILHSKDCHLMALFLEQPLQVHCHDAVTTAGVVELVCYEYAFFLHVESAKVVIFSCC